MVVRDRAEVVRTIVRVSPAKLAGGDGDAVVDRVIGGVGGACGFHRFGEADRQPGTVAEVHHGTRVGRVLSPVTVRLAERVLVVPWGLAMKQRNWLL